jgi:TonB-dependent SusC/RagA subfamily outer membrane receptor
MNRIAAIFITLLFFLHASAQAESDIPAQSPVTLVYKISGNEAGALYGNKRKQVGEEMLRHCVDTLRGIAATLPHSYPHGHYLLAGAQGNNVHFRLVSSAPFEHRMLNNQRDMAVAVFHRTTGETIAGAVVKVGGHRLPWDDATQSYRRRTTDRHGFMSIEAGGITAYGTVTRTYSTNLWKRIKGGLWNAPVVKYVSRPVIFTASIPADAYRSLIHLRPAGTVYTIQKPFADVYRSIRWGSLYGWLYRFNRFSGDKRDHSEGFMVFSKPKYRPDDTIRFKAYVTDKKGKPATDSLNVYLYTDKNNKAGTIAPYRPGFYTMEFVPKAGWGMKLDRQYEVRLTGGRSHWNGYFTYEDYELQSLTCMLRTDKAEYLRHEEAVFYAKAVDENSMPAMDARVELTLLTESVRDFDGNMVHVPTVLWKKEMTLDPAGETKIVVPDSVWPDASVNAQLTALFSNSDNQTDRKDVRFVRRNTSGRIVARQHGDSLHISYEHSGKPAAGMKAHITAHGLSAADTLIMLPASFHIHPLASSYEAAPVSVNGVAPGRAIDTATFTPSAGNSGVACSMELLHDSIFIAVSNPLGLPLIYTIYKGNRELHRGSGQLPAYGNRAGRKDYFLSVQYVWGGCEQNLEYRSSHNDAQLYLHTSAPAVVYPGQTVKINIAAVDAGGNPVPGVDLTAWGYTAKFGSQGSAGLPSYRKPQKNRRAYNSFHTGEPKEVWQHRELDYGQWRTPLRLDSAELYRFAYPGREIYRYELPAADGKTYIAPYLVHSGKLLPVQIAYIDDRPVYFGRTTTISPYVFAIAGDTIAHEVRLRTSEFEVTARIVARQGHKTIISIDPYGLNELERRYTENDWANVSVRGVWKKDRYTILETRHMQNYLLRVRYNSSGKFAWLQNGSAYELLTSATDGRMNYNSIFTTGPNYGATPVTLWEESRPLSSFQRGGIRWEGYNPFVYHYSKVVPFVKHRSALNFDYRTPALEWSALPYTQHYVDSISHRWDMNRRRPGSGRPFTGASQQANAPLQIETAMSAALQSEGWCWVLYGHRWEDTYLFPVAERKFNVQQGDMYSLILLMEDKTFYMLDSISVDAGATTMLRLPLDSMQRSTLPIDSCLRQFRPLLREINHFSGISVDVPPEPGPVQETVEYNPAYAGSMAVCGTVTDDAGQPVPGVRVKVKGTITGTMTNLEGKYCIGVPDGYRTLQYSFVGFAAEERTPLHGGTVDVAMHENSQALEEVVVTGYGVQKRDMVMTASVATVTSGLEGRVLGVAVSDNADESIRIRGVGALDTGVQPLYIVDGVEVTDISHLTAANIASMNVLKDASATALYGARAANGVVVITTGGGVAATDAQDIMKQMFEDEAYQTGLASAKGLRTNFSDEAFWQPALTTDHTGVASFSATFPDDITRWDIRFAGLLPGKASAETHTQVRSLKPLSAQLAIPRFMVEGDTAGVIGKVMNYGQDTAHVNTVFAVNGSEKISKAAAVRHSLTDTLMVAAPSIDTTVRDAGNIHTFADSMAVSYQLTRNDGYKDGEERHIPIVMRGAVETFGQFHVLDTDTTITLTFNEADSPATLSIESSSLDIMMKEARRLRDYQHLCNEQTASRLKALLLERKAYALHGEEYPYDRHIRSLADRLIRGISDNGLWGWFAGSEPEIWISAHAAEALLQARDDGFAVDMDFESITSRLILDFDRTVSADRIRILELLVRIKPESNYRTMFDRMNSDMQSSLIHCTDSLRLLTLGVHFGEKPDIEKVLQRKHTDRLGNIHWTEPDGKSWRYNEVTATLAAYRLLRTCGGHDRTLMKIRNYLLAQRSHYGWRNTWETANILSTIMPDLLASGDSLGSSRVRISGGHTAAVDTFPKHIVLRGNRPVVIEKQGSFPVYVTAWQDRYLHNPAPADEGFLVTTRFAVNDEVLKTSEPSMNLVAGKAATLDVTVSSDVSSEYVMIEIPIPAGCSYQSKPQQWYRGMGETHREYFRDRVCIYLRHLNSGSHTFSVELMPRYTGIYSVNPAKAERMYMPLYSGRTGMKQVKIGE